MLAESYAAIHRERSMAHSSSVQSLLHGVLTSSLPNMNVPVAEEISAPVTAGSGGQMMRPVVRRSSKDPDSNSSTPSKGQRDHKLQQRVVALRN